ncbi:MAG: hypothetical protein PHH70_04945 [Candidatus Gracilibacteria bacterium]|nr:hypothetical protein [Candidatus Gracilibacteria bacterium]
MSDHGSHGHAETSHAPKASSGGSESKELVSPAMSGVLALFMGFVGILVQVVLDGR